MIQRRAGGRERQTAPVGGADGRGARAAAAVEEHDRIAGADAQHGLQVSRRLAAERLPPLFDGVWKPGLIERITNTR